MGNPTVSVVIAAHPGRCANGMLRDATTSVWGQSRPPDAVHVAIDHDGLGAPPTRQRALSYADTDWVAFLDSDDLFMPRHLELLLKHAEKSGADFVYSWFRILQQTSSGHMREIPFSPETGDGVFPPGHYLNDFDPTSEDTIIETTMTVLVRTELAKQVGMRALNRGEVNTGEDRAFTLDCWKAGAKISHLKRVTWLWRHHWMLGGGKGNTSGHPNQGDAA